MVQLQLQCIEYSSTAISKHKFWCFVPYELLVEVSDFTSICSRLVKTPPIMVKIEMSQGKWKKVDWRLSSWCARMSKG